MGQFQGWREGIFRYRRTPEAVEIYAALDENPATVIPTSAWISLLTGLRGFGGAIAIRPGTIGGLHDIDSVVRGIANQSGVQLGNVDQAVPRIVAVLEHEGSIDLDQSPERAIMFRERL